MTLWHGRASIWTSCPASRAAPLALALGAVARSGLVALLRGLSRRQGAPGVPGLVRVPHGPVGRDRGMRVSGDAAGDGGRGAVDDGVNGAGDPSGLRVALGWFSIGFPLALAYLAALFRMHRGKAVAAADGEGY